MDDEKTRNPLKTTASFLAAAGRIMAAAVGVYAAYREVNGKGRETAAPESLAP